MQVEDLVVVINNVSTPTMHLLGKMGKIRYIKDASHIGVEFLDRIAGGHNLNDHLPNSNGFYFTPEQIKIVKPISQMCSDDFENNWKPLLIKVKPKDKDISILVEE